LQRATTSLLLQPQRIKIEMGKGDKKTKKGKIFIGSYGNSRKRASNKPSGKAATAAKPVAEVVVPVVVAEEKPKAKRTTKKKEAAE
jgi:30S ribosomal protein S31